ncbi:MAG: hypothetical protein RIR11_3270 [Bacteroidota bacterium]|jgi:hypothetical protein
MTAQAHIKLGRQTALISFLLGTGIFWLYFLTSFAVFLFLGYCFIVLAGLVNIIIFICILLKANQDRENSRTLLMTCGIMLLNIPAMLFYCWAGCILLDTMRITFTNSTQFTLTDINIAGCENKHIDKLEKGCSKTVWVNIPGNCSISINYMSNGQRKVEDVEGYVTHSMGEITSHNILGN